MKDSPLTRVLLTWLRDSGIIEQEANLIPGMFVPHFVLRAAIRPCRATSQTGHIRAQNGHPSPGWPYSIRTRACQRHQLYDRERVGTNHGGLDRIGH